MLQHAHAGKFLVWVAAISRGRTRVVMQLSACRRHRESKLVRLKPLARLAPVEQPNMQTSRSLAQSFDMSRGG